MNNATDAPELEATATLPARTPVPGPARPAVAPPAPRPAGGHRRTPGGYAAADLPPEPASAALARRLTRAALRRWHLTGLTDDAQAVATELVSNAVTAATRTPGTRPAIILAIQHRPGEIRITVWDNGPGQPERKAPGPDAVSGRGLAIVSELSRAWGWRPTPRSGGKVTWAACATADIGDDS